MILSSWIYAGQLRSRQWLTGFRYACKQNKSPVVDPTVFLPSKLLIVVTGLLGDSVMSAPVIAEAKSLWPGTHLTVLGMSHNRDLLRADPNIDDFYICNADPFSIRKTEDVSRLREWLSGQKFDVGIILLGDQYAHLLAEAKIAVRVGVKGTVLEPCLTHTYDIKSPREWGSNERLNALRSLGYSVEPREAKLWVDDDARSSAAKKIGIDERYLVVHPFGSTQRQWLPLDKASDLLSRVVDMGVKPVLIGGKETIGASINGTGVVDTRGKLTLPELVAVIDSAAAVVTTDSGPFHIAGALGKRTVGMFRSRRPEHAFSYVNARVVLGSNDQCTSQCDWDKCAASECRQMADVETENVVRMIRESIDL